jgi:hypothetical protein
MSDDRMSFRAYAVIKREGEEDFWLPIGAVFPHRDGKGYNVILQAQPLDGKLVLRVPKEADGDKLPARRESDRAPDKDQRPPRRYRQRQN